MHSADVLRAALALSRKDLVRSSLWGWHGPDGLDLSSQASFAQQPGRSQPGNKEVSCEGNWQDTVTGQLRNSCCAAQSGTSIPPGFLQRVLGFRQTHLGLDNYMAPGLLGRKEREAWSWRAGKEPAS